MEAFYLIKNGKAEEAFELRSTEISKPTDFEIVIDTEAFGLNFADVMARLGYYKACPPLPAVIGYDVVGRVIETGDKVERIKVGDRVTALTRFGGYSKRVVTSSFGAVVIPEDTDVTEALALATQYATAYYASEIAMQMHEGEHVLIQAAAGGVGTALVQLAKRRGCIVYGTAGSDEKIEYLKKIGVDFPINYNKIDFYDYIREKRGLKSMDVIFDSIGGDYVKKATRLLAPCGRLAIYGAAQIAGNSSKKNMLRALKTLWGFGKYSPTQFFGENQSLIGVNMLQLGDYKPQILKKCMREVVELYKNGEIKPTVGKVFKADELVEAHKYLQERKSVGKTAVVW